MAPARHHVTAPDDAGLQTERSPERNSERNPHRPDREAVLRFVERFAILLTEIGMQRMPARVFAYVLIDDAERYTAAELSEALRVSPAAISGAVRTLVRGGLVSKEREPGARVDTYRVHDDNLWHTIMTQRSRSIASVMDLAAEGVELLGTATMGGRRMFETLEFYRFLDRKLATVMDEWQVYKRTLFDPPHPA